MALPELFANSPTPGTRAPLARLAAAITTTPSAGTSESWGTTAAAPTALQATGQYRIVIDAEILIVTAGAAGTTWTMTRGAEGTMPATHPTNTPIYHYLTAGALQAGFPSLDDPDTARANLKVPTLRHVQCVATTNQALSGALPTIDSYAVQDGDRVLLAGQTTGSQNGVWVAHTAGWVRPGDYPTGITLTSRIVGVTGGNTWASTAWELVSTTSITIDTTATTWQSIGRAAGTGLTLTANTLAVNYGTTSGTATQGNDSRFPQISALTADLAAISSQTTLQNITGLGLSIGASATEIWLVKYWLVFSAANATMDVKFGFTFPASCTMRGGPIVGNTGAISGWAAVAAAASPAALNIQTTVPVFGTGSATLGVALFYVVYGGGTSGTVQIQYAQNTSDAGNLQMLKGSVMEAVKAAA